MAFVGSFNSRLYVGTQAWSAYARGYSWSDDTDMLDITTLVDTSKQFIPGLRSATANLDLLLDGVTQLDIGMHSAGEAQSRTDIGLPRAQQLLAAQAHAAGAGVSPRPYDPRVYRGTARDLCLADRVVPVRSVPELTKERITLFTKASSVHGGEGGE